MNELNQAKMAQVFDGIANNSIYIYYGKIPEECDVRPAVALKREGRYEESLSYYLDIILKTKYILTELGRSMAKTLCAMNEYTPAFLMLLSCAKVKWEDKVLNPLYAAMGISQASMPTLPTACAEDLYELTDYLKKVLKGNYNPLLQRTAEWSGNRNYVQIQSHEYVLQQAQWLSNANLLRWGEH